jgi:hypothetical protein
MPNFKKMLMILVALLVVALGIGVVVAKIYIGKTLKNPEIRKEIELIVGAQFGGVLARPRVVIGSLIPKGFSTLIVNRVQVFDDKALVYSAPRSEVQCSIFAQVLLGYCNLKVKISLGTDGEIFHSMTLPRSLLFADEHYHYNLDGEGRFDSFNIYKLLNQKSSDRKSPLNLNSAIIEGTYKFSLVGAGEPTPVIIFDGSLKKANIEINLRGKRQQNISIPILAFKIEQKRLTFSQPLQTKILGVPITYSGGLAMKDEMAWEGAVKVDSVSMISKFIPMLFQCRSKPTNPLSFKILGPVGSPTCR